MRLIMIIITSMIAIVGCKRSRLLDVPVNRDLLNARFEDGIKHWKFAFDEQAGKTCENEGVNNTTCIRLLVGPHKQSDCFSQAVNPLGALYCQASAYVRATGTNIKARIRLECFDPDQYGNERNYGQLAEANSEVCLADGQWTILRVAVMIPKKTKYIRIFALVDGTDGAAYFDDFQVSRE